MGALSAVLHFLPYIGPWLAAAGPIALALAAFPGWSELLLTVALFVSLELVSNNVLEPWLYGSSVGLSPFGVVVSAIFWTSLWGIPGLLLATPLTVCLVVAGRYVRGLEYFPVLLGDRPALLPDVRLYQRLLALDLDEGAAVLSKAAAEGSLEAASDSVVLPVLRRLASDDQRDLVRDPVSAGVRERLEQLLDDLLEKGDSRVPADGPRVLFVPALDESDALSRRAGSRSSRRPLAREARGDVWAALRSRVIARAGERAGHAHRGRATGRHLHQRPQRARPRQRPASLQAPGGGGERSRARGWSVGGGAARARRAAAGCGSADPLDRHGGGAASCTGERSHALEQREDKRPRRP